MSDREPFYRFFEIFRGSTMDQLLEAMRSRTTPLSFSYRSWTDEFADTVSVYLYTLGVADSEGSHRIELVSLDARYLYRGTYNPKTKKGRFARELLPRRKDEERINEKAPARPVAASEPAVTEPTATV